MRRRSCIVFSENTRAINKFTWFSIIGSKLYIKSFKTYTEIQANFQSINNYFSFCHKCNKLKNQRTSRKH